MIQYASVRTEPRAAARYLATFLLSGLLAFTPADGTASRAETIVPSADLGQRLESLSPGELESLLTEDDATILVLANGTSLELPMTRLAGAVGYTYFPVEPCRAALVSLRDGQQRSLALRRAPGQIMASGADEGCALPGPFANTTPRALGAALSFKLSGLADGRLDLWSAGPDTQEAADFQLDFRQDRTTQGSAILPLCGGNRGIPCGVGDLALRAAGGDVTAEITLLGYFEESSPPQPYSDLFFAAAQPQSGSSCTETFAVCRSPTGSSSGCTCASAFTCGAICAPLKNVTNNFGSSCSVTSTYGGCSADDSTCPFPCNAACCECEL